MGKYSRKNVGSIYKSKLQDQSDYLVFRIPEGEELTFRNGDKLQVETKDFRLKNIEQGVANGRLSEDVALALKEKAEKTPEFVRAELVLLTKN